MKIFIELAIILGIVWFTLHNIIKYFKEKNANQIKAAENYDADAKKAEIINELQQVEKNLKLNAEERQKEIDRLNERLKKCS